MKIKCLLFTVLIASCLMFVSCESELEKRVTEMNTEIQKQDEGIVQSIAVTGDKEVTYTYKFDLLKSEIKKDDFDMLIKNSFFNPNEKNEDVAIFKQYGDITVIFKFIDRNDALISDYKLTPDQY